MKILAENPTSATPLPASENNFRAEKFNLLSAIRKIYSAQGKKAGLKFPMDFHRTAKCKFVSIAKNSPVSIFQETTSKKAFFGGLHTCGSVWTCPVCASKIESKRQLEISKFFSWAYRKDFGKKVVMMTLTFPHKSDQPLDENLKLFLSALRKLRAGKRWVKFKENHGYEGLIRALEINHGTNGWHPHTHELWVVDSSVDADLLRASVTKAWLSVLKKVGLLDDDDTVAAKRYAVDVKDKMSSTQYLTKHGNKSQWGGDKEMAKACTKKGKKSGKAPFQIAESAANGCAKSEKLWLEYTAATKGKSRLFWSAGLKKRVGINDKSDDLLASEMTEKAVELGSLNRIDWYLVRDGKNPALLLDYAERGGWPAVLSFIDSVKQENLNNIDPAQEKEKPG